MVLPCKPRAEDHTEQKPSEGPDDPRIEVIPGVLESHFLWKEALDALLALTVSLQRWEFIKFHGLDPFGEVVFPGYTTILYILCKSVYGGGGK